MPKYNVEVLISRRYSSVEPDDAIEAPTLAEAREKALTYALYKM
jgi:hypothetical protein